MRSDVDTGTDVENQSRNLVHESVHESDQTAHFHSNNSTY